MHLVLEHFDCPLDVLAHLIKVQEINVFNIPMALVCEQFLQFLNQLPQLDFQLAGEYLVMAAQLVEIKASLLIPALQNTPAPEPQTLDQMNTQDPRRPLVEMLLARESLQELTLFLDKRWNREPVGLPSGEALRRAQELDDLPAPILGDAFSLVIAWERILLKFAAQKSKPKVKVHAQRITIQKKMSFIFKNLESADSVGLFYLFESCLDRYEIIVTLMATLELAKEQCVQLHQERDFEDITLLKSKNFSPETLKRLAENSDTAFA